MLIPFLDAVNTVCMNCVEDTLNNEGICENCPVRHTVDATKETIKPCKITFSVNEDIIEGPYNAIIHAIDKECAIQEAILSLMDGAVNISSIEEV